MLEALRVHHGDALKIVTIGDKVKDVEGHATAAYGVQEDTLFVVRPDGYIGLVTRDRMAETIEQYLSLLGS